MANLVQAAPPAPAAAPPSQQPTTNLPIGGIQFNWNGDIPAWFLVRD